MQSMLRISGCPEYSSGSIYEKYFNYRILKSSFFPSPALGKSNYLFCKNSLSKDPFRGKKTSPAYRIIKSQRTEAKCQMPHLATEQQNKWEQIHFQLLIFYLSLFV